MLKIKVYYRTYSSSKTKYRKYLFTNLTSECVRRSARWSDENVIDNVFLPSLAVGYKRKYILFNTKNRNYLILGADILGTVEAFVLNESSKFLAEI